MAVAVLLLADSVPADVVAGYAVGRPSLHSEYVTDDSVKIMIGTSSSFADASIGDFRFRRHDLAFILPRAHLEDRCGLA
jgi:hypothetical protein